MKQIEVAVLPVAGLGTRFLPVTKSAPKEMLPIVDKPMIQYVLEEALSAGITEFVLVTSHGKRAIEDYFDANYELEERLRQLGKKESLSMIRNILPSHVSLTYVRQAHPCGLGNAVLCAKPVVRQRPFAVLLPDDIIDTPGDSCLQGMLEVFRQTQSSVLAVEDIPSSEIHLYGIVSLAQRSNVIESIIEKPHPEAAPSNLAVAGRYLLTPRIFELLETVPAGSNNEIQLTDAIADLLKEETVRAYLFNGKRYDCGSRMGFLKATVAYALKSPVLGESFRRYLSSLRDSELKYQ